MISNMHKNNLMNSPFSFSYGLIVLMWSQESTEWV